MAASAALIACVQCPAVAFAGDWTFTSGVSLSEDYTDNVDLVPKTESKTADFITDISPFLSVRGTGARLSGNLDYRFRQLIFAESKGDEQLNELAANGQVEYWEQIGFLDATASISQQVVDSDAPSSNSPSGLLVNRTNAYSVGLSPFFLYHFGRWADSEVRFRYGYVIVDEDTISNTENYGATINLNGGREFSRFRWDLSVSGDRTNRYESDGQNQPKITSLQASLGNTYAVSRSVGLITSVGYENIDDGTLDNQIKGTTWSAGFSYNPTSRTSMTLTYGRQYDDTSFALEAVHTLSSRTTLRASYNETLQISQGIINQDASFIGVDENGNLIDIRTGEPFDPGDAAFGLQNDTFRQRRATFSIVGTRQRNNFGFNFYWENRETDATDGDDTAFGGGVNLGRALTPRTNANLAVTYDHGDFSEDGGHTDNTFTFNVSLSYQIFRNTSAVIGGGRTQRASTDDANAFTENTAFIRLSQNF